MALPDDPDGRRMELRDGRVSYMPPPGEEHADVAFNLLQTLSAFVASRGLGKVRNDLGFQIRSGPDRVVAPDVAFIATSQLTPGRNRSGAVPGAPALAVEVVSPTDRDADIAEKVEEYLAAGSTRVWVVRPRLRTVTVHRPGGDAHTFSAADTLTSDEAAFPAPGFALPVGAAFG